MKISTNLTEIKELFARHLGINVSELELTIESEDVPVTSHDDSDGWVINTQTRPVHPTCLAAKDKIEVILSDVSKPVVNSADQWDESWNILDKYRHIVKYRKVNK